MYTHIAYLSTEQKTRPVGVRVVEPPSDTRQAVRGYLYVVVEYASADPAHAQLVERALSVIQRTYYTIKGTQTFVLTEALREGMALFPVMPGGASTAVPAPGIVLMALAGDKLTAVGAGPAVALLTSGQNVDVYPPYVTGATAAGRAGQDVQNTLDFYRQEVPLGGTVMLAGQRCLQHFTLRELASIVAYVTEENVADVAETLRNQAGSEQLTGLIVVISPDDEPAPVVTRALRSPLQRKRHTSLPGALSGQLPARASAPNVSDRADFGPGAQGERAEPAAPISGGHLGQRASGAELPPALSHPGQSDVEGYDDAYDNDYDDAYNNDDVYDNYDNAQSVVARDEYQDAQAAQPKKFLPSTTLRGMAERAIERTQTIIGAILPDRAASRQPDDRLTEQLPVSARQEAPSRPVQSPLAHALPTDSQGYATAESPDQPYAAYETTAHAAPVPSASATIQPTTPTADGRLARGAAPIAVPARSIGRRARLFTLLAILILLLTVVIVATVFWTTGRSNIVAADELLSRAEASYLSAQNALAIEDKVSARLNLIDAQAFIAEANDVVGTRMERADQLNARVEQQLADLLQVQPLHALAVPLVRFSETAQPQRVVVSDQDIYVLDTGRQVVQFFALDATQNIVAAPEGETILAQGDVVNGVTVGRLVDITWLPAIPGVQDLAYLLILDGNNKLFRYDRRVEGASYVDLGGQDELRAPVRMGVYAERLYIADAGANQIFRYGRGNFNEPPEKWLDAQTENNLSSLRAMAIDGSIWLLFSEGLLSRFDAGDQVQFSLENSFGQIEDPVDLAVGREGTSLIYVADNAGERILVFTKAGQYLRQLRAPEGDALRNLRGISVDEIGGVMYILTQSALFQHPIID